MLGVSADDPLTADARRWLQAQPNGVLSNPTWGKYWLAFLDLYGYEGLNPCPPELFFLPESLPLHPNRYYCHTRYIYIGLSYLHGARFRANLGPLRDELRLELYSAPYDSIDFAAHKNDVARTDLYVPATLGLRLSFRALEAFERVHLPSLRRRALDDCFERISYEQRISRYQGLSPVNALLNCLAIYSRSPKHPDLAPSVDGIEAWRWEDEAEGVRYAGARSNAWDTAFAMMALCEEPALLPRAADALRRGYRFLRDAQLVEELPRQVEERRDPALGGWCFSDGKHRWPVSDCTAEALSAILKLHARMTVEEDRIGNERLRDAAEFILLRQNDDGGFGTYERRRGSAWLEGINPTEMYGACMTERSYLECTASSVAALAELRRTPPFDSHEGARSLGGRIDRSVARGVALLRKAQRPDGGYPGFWGVNFTYAIFHVVKGLRAAGVPADDATLVRAAEWLVGKQKRDGGWGEHYLGCLGDRYLEHPQSQVVMTSWALLALLDVFGARHPAVERGVAWLAAQQQPDGGFPGAAQNGVFFGSAMLDYRFYKAYFPTWALARYQRLRRATGA
jgi:lanosterol synthase